MIVTSSLVQHLVSIGTLISISLVFVNMLPYNGRVSLVIKERHYLLICLLWTTEFAPSKNQCSSGSRMVARAEQCNQAQTRDQHNNIYYLNVSNPRKTTLLFAAVGANEDHETALLLGTWNVSSCRSDGRLGRKTAFETEEDK